MTGWFGIACVRCRWLAQWLSFGSAFGGRWFGLQLERSRYTLLMKPNKFGTAAQCFRMSRMKRRINTSTLQGNWKNVGNESDIYTNCNWCSCYNNQRINEGTGGLGNKRTSGDHLNYCINVIGRILRSVLKTSGDLLSLKLQQKAISWRWGARGVVVIIVWNWHGDTSSNPGRDWLHFT